MQKNKINAVIEANNAAVYAGNIDAILATFEPEGLLMAQPEITSKGKIALTEAFKQFIAIKPKISILNHEVIIADNIAVHNSTWKLLGKTPDGQPIEQSGYSVIVLRKQPSGNWLIVIDNPFGNYLTTI